MSHDSPPCEESTLGTLDTIVLVERSGMLPVSEANSIVVGTATQVEDDTKDNETSDGDNFYGSILGVRVSSTEKWR